MKSGWYGIGRDRSVHREIVEESHPQRPQIEIDRQVLAHRRIDQQRVQRVGNLQDATS